MKNIVVMALLTTGMAVGLLPAKLNAQTGIDCSSGSVFEHSFPSGAIWTGCISIDTHVGMRIQQLHYQAPGDSLRQTFSEIHLAGVLEHHHAQPSEHSVLETLPLGGEHFVDFTQTTCPGELISVQVGSTENTGTLCSVISANKLLAKFSDKDTVNAHRIDLIAAASDGRDSWETIVSLNEEGSITPTLVRSGVVHHFTDDRQYGSPISADQLAVNSTVLATWRLVPALNSFNQAPPTDNLTGEAGQTITQWDFALRTDLQNRRPMRGEVLRTETLRQVHPEHFRMWEITQQDGIGYSIDVQNNGFRYRSSQYNWSLFDVAVTKYNPCEITTLNNVAYLANRSETSEIFEGLNKDNKKNNAKDNKNNTRDNTRDNKIVPILCGDSLSEFISGDSLEQANPVVWFSQAIPIYPNSGDVPLIKPRTLSFDLVPLNWTLVSPFVPSTNESTTAVDSELGYRQP